jgi:hypothetical protein
MRKCIDCDTPVDPNGLIRVMIAYGRGRERKYA